jgi:sugar phosphate isomerase/epimerase
MGHAPIGIAHLTLLGLGPPDLVTTAAEAGYDFVGVRVRPVTPAEPRYPMEPGSPLSRATLARLADTGLEVRDVEFLPLGPDTGPADWLPALEAGGALGARTFSVTGADPDRGRLTDTLARLVADAAPYGIRPTLEPISYQPVSRVADAAAVARAAGAEVLVDALHVHRGGSDLAEVRALGPVPLVQLCDAPLAAPTDLRAEAREQREVVGEGALPLADLLAALPAGTPLSVEVPHAALAARLTPGELAAHHLRAVRALLTEEDSDG